MVPLPGPRIYKPSQYSFFVLCILHFDYYVMRGFYFLVKYIWCSRGFLYIYGISFFSDFFFFSDFVEDFFFFLVLCIGNVHSLLYLLFLGLVFSLYPGFPGCFGLGVFLCFVFLELFCPYLQGILHAWDFPHPPTSTSSLWHSPTVGHLAFIGPRAFLLIDDRLGHPLLHMQLEPWVPPHVLFGW